VLEHVVDGERWLAVGRPHVCEDHAVVLADRVPGLAHPVAVPAKVRLARLLQAAALSIEDPAVVAAADALILDPAIKERRPPVRAVRHDEPGLAALGAEEDEILTEDPQPLRRRGRVCGQRDRLPVPAQYLPVRRARPDLGEFE
jgi:hypothetical protein